MRRGFLIGKNKDMAKYYYVDRTKIKKIGINDLCWCDSGLKYKKCHLNREKQNKVSKQYLHEKLKQSKNKYKYCSVNGCNNKNIIKAHSVSISDLKKIANKGEVYTTEFDLFDMRGLPYFKLKGIHKSSIFTGFCEKHDNKIFFPLENYDFIGNKEQCLLLAYRAVSMECHKKICSRDTDKIIRECDRGKDIHAQREIVDVANNYKKGNNLAIIDLENERKILEDILIKKNYDKLQTFVVNFKEIPSILCNSAIVPENNFLGHELVDLNDANIKFGNIHFSTIANKNGGSFVLSWIDSNSYCEKFVNSLMILNPNNITNRIIKLLVGWSENIFINPKWFNSLNKYKQDIIKNYSYYRFKNDSINYLCSYDNLDDWKAI